MKKINLFNRICVNCQKPFYHKDKRQKNCSRECFKKYSSKLFLGVPQGLIGKKSPNWKGDKISYFTIHKWLKINYGKADKCENTKCSSKNPKRFEWALKKGKIYLRRRSHFIKLCTKCHHAYDDITNKGWKTRKSNVT